MLRFLQDQTKLQMYDRPERYIFALSALQTSGSEVRSAKMVAIEPIHFSNEHEGAMGSHFRTDESSHGTDSQWTARQFHYTLMTAPSSVMNHTILLLSVVYPCSWRSSL